MKLTAELSLYPVQEDYIAVIDAFIAGIRAQPDLQVVTNAMSTQICGDYARVFAVISDTLAATTRQFGKQVLVVKFIPWELELRR
ncbi:MAG: thiamine-binding protein [Halioglobus sp.]|nr:thiamine-binding protein [Halioglobus sp.]